MKKICVLIAAVLLLTGFSGCGQNGDTNGKATEITVATSFSSEDGNHENFVAAYEAYALKTGNTVIDQSQTSNEEWKSEIMAQFNNGNEPDVLFYFTGADATALIESGKVVSISEIRKSYPDYASNMKDSMMPVSSADGRQYAVPVNGYWEGLYINKKVLAACGVEEPGADYTWDQFLLDCQTIKDNGYTPIACSLNQVPHYWFEFCTFNHGNLANHTAIPASADDGTGNIWTAGLRDIKDLYNRGFFPADTNTITDTEANFLMTTDQAAFMIDGSWKIGWFQTNAADINDFAVTYVPAKGDRRATDIVGGLSMGYYISKRAWNDPAKREACVRFVMEMTSDEVVSDFGALAVTALKNGTTPPENSDALMVSALEMTKGCTGIVPAAQDGLSLAARAALFGDVKNIVTGAMTPEEALDNCLAIA